MQIDAEAAAALSDLAWPLRRDAALSRLVALGGGCIDLLLSCADSGSGERGEDAPCKCSLKDKSSQNQEVGGQNEPGLGLRFWSWYALRRMQVAHCTAGMRAMMAGPTSNEADVIERGALLIVSRKAS